MNFITKVQTTPNRIAEKIPVVNASKPYSIWLSHGYSWLMNIISKNSSCVY